MRDLKADSVVSERLLQEARAGDGQALEQLLTRNESFLRRFVEMRLDPQLQARVDPSDIVQEARLEAVRRLDVYLADPVMPFRLWLRHLAHDQLLMMRRRHYRAARRS